MDVNKRKSEVLISEVGAVIETVQGVYFPGNMKEKSKRKEEKRKTAMEKGKEE